MKGFPDLPPIWFFAALAIVIGIDWTLPQWSIQFAGQFYIGWATSLSGFALIFWAAFWFFRRKTPIEPHHKATTLLIEGPFRFSRNPIYLGLVFILAGSIIGRGCILAVPILPIFVVVLQKRFIIPEEQALVEVFASEAREYISKTSRWLLM